MNTPALLNYSLFHCMTEKVGIHLILFYMIQDGELINLLPFYTHLFQSLVFSGQPYRFISTNVFQRGVVAFFGSQGESMKAVLPPPKYCA